MNELIEFVQTLLHALVTDARPVLIQLWFIVTLLVSAACFGPEIVRVARRCSSRVRHRAENVAADVEHFFATVGGGE